MLIHFNGALTSKTQRLRDSDVREMLDLMGKFAALPTEQFADVIKVGHRARFHWFVVAGKSEPAAVGDEGQWPFCLVTSRLESSRARPRRDAADSMFDTADAEMELAIIAPATREGYFASALFISRGR